MKILVVTPTRGQSPWLPKTVASVGTLPIDCTHVLVAPADAVVALSRQYPSLTVMAESSGGGMYAALNAGIAMADEWDAFTYINDDDELLPPFVEVVDAAARFRPRGGQPAIVYGRVRLIDRNGRRIGAIPISPAPDLNRALYAQRLEPVFQHGTLVTRAAWETLGGFDETLRFCGDSEFLARACLLHLPFVRATGREVAAFRLRAGQLTKNREAMNAERARVDEKLGLLVPPPGSARRWARWRFRLANLHVYAERIARHGWKSFDKLLVEKG